MATAGAWRKFGIEALDSSLLEDRKFMTKSFEQTESLMAPVVRKQKVGRPEEATGPVPEMSEDKLSQSTLGLRKLTSDVGKCLEVLRCEDTESIVRTIRGFSTRHNDVLEEQPRLRVAPRREQDECTVRVSNLADSVTEVELEKLFNRVGDVTRAFLVCNRETQMSRGFAFVSFRNKTDAARAIETFNGRGFVGCVLGVELASRRE